MSIFRTIILIVILAAGYLAFWPVPIDPVAWTSPEDPGLESGAYAATHDILDGEIIDLGGFDGPEDFAEGPDGAIYTAVHDGSILKFDPASKEITAIARTEGRPLGVDFGDDGLLYIADAYLGLLSLDVDTGALQVLATEAGGLPILYADDLEVIGRKVYFSDASTKFGATSAGGTLDSSILELMEHGKTGRVLVHDLDTSETEVLATGFSFPNGVTRSATGGSEIIVAETGLYRLLAIETEGPRRGEVTVIADAMPGFPDNVELGPDGLYWVGLTSPRLPGIDALSEQPFLRKVAVRLPRALRPKPLLHGAVMSFDAEGRVRHSFQDPTGQIATTAGALRTEDALYISRLEGPNFVRFSPGPD
ncbi:MAG: SMP-30/gluconolactonase/LRE family protein [Pseudomonadota bacterium]